MPNKKRILFVDDEPMILQALRRMLHHMSSEWEMVFVASGQEALDQVSRFPFDVLITDMRMPSMNGVQLLEKMVQFRPQIARIILSGHADREMALRAVGLAHQFLAKPCDPEELKDAIARTCLVRDLLAGDALKGIFSRLRSIPSIPSLYMRLVNELRSSNASIQRVADIIGEDPGMTAKVLQLVNSAFFGLPCRVAGPAHAVRLLGIETISALTLTIHIFDQFEGSTFGDLNLNALWRHCKNVGLFAREIARAEGMPEKAINDAFIGGSLHDVGQLILAANLPDQYREVAMRIATEHLPRHQAETDLIGANHSDAAAYLLGLWGLSDAMIEAVMFHHVPLNCPALRFSPLSAVHLGNEIDHLLTHSSSTLNVAQIPKENRSELIPCTTREYLVALKLEQRWPDWLELCLDLKSKVDEEGQLP